MVQPDGGSERGLAQVGAEPRGGGGREGLQMCEVTMILMHDFSEITVQNLSLHHLLLFKNHFLPAEQKLTQLRV